MINRNLFNSHIRKSDGCWEWTGIRTKSGYGIWWYGMSHSNRKRLRAHRVAWEFENGPVPDGLFVLHDCDNRGCVNPSHLKVGTKKQNSIDAARRLRLRTSKLSLDQVREIRGLKWREKSRDIAKRFGVCQGTISHIWTSRNWKHL